MWKIAGFFTDSIYKKLILSVFICIILPVTILYIYTFDWFEKIMIDNATRSAFSNMYSIRLNLDNTIDKILSTTRLISNNKYVMNIAKEQNSQRTIDVDSKIEIENMFNNIALNYLDTELLITIIPQKGDIYSTWPKSYMDYTYFRKEKWFDEGINQGMAFVWIAPQEQFVQYADSNDKYLISVASGIPNASYTNTQGVVLTSIGQKALYHQIFSGDSDADGKEMFLTNPDGAIICHKQQEKIGTKAEFIINNPDILKNESGYTTYRQGNQKMLINYLTVDKCNWKMIQVLPYDKVIQEAKKMTRRVLLLVSLLFVVLILLMLLIASKITLPLKKLMKLMKRVEKDDMDVKIIPEGNDEISQLGWAFNSMMAKQKELVGRIAEEERTLAKEQKKKEEIRFEMLMAQVNPHFLFNTLNTIKWTALMSGAETVGEMVSSLGKLLEMSTGRGNDFITLTEEIENTRHYLYIQKIRFNDRFSVYYDIAGNTGVCLVPKLILQPLVENSVIHGFQENAKGNWIKISTFLEDQVLVIVVSDNGKGMRPEAAKALLNANDVGSNEKNHRFSGIGVSNVHQRIQLYYGYEYGLAIKSTPMAGTEIRITLPLKLKGDETA